MRRQETMNDERGTMNERQIFFSSSFIVPRSSFLYVSAVNAFVNLHALEGLNL
jgi:hypothetical protein